MTPQALPYAPRALTHRELTALDTYLFHSPKALRAVSLVDPLRLAFWLEREFDPATTAIIERPRTLELAEGRTVELDFWVRTRDGRERFWIAVATGDTRATASQRVPRDLPDWTRAAQRAGLELAFLYEYEWERRALPFSNHLRLLPHVQAFDCHPAASRSLACVKDAFGPGVMALTFRQIDQMCPELDCGVARMAACALIHRGWLAFDTTLPLRTSTPLARPEAA